MGKVAKWIRHNQGLFVVLVLCVALVAWVIGCESRVRSFKDPNVKVTREELVLEIRELANQPGQDPNMLYEQAKIKFAKLDRDDAIKVKLFDLVAVSASTGGVNPAGVVALIGSILGVGLAVDNRIKDKVIKNRPLKG